MKEVDYSKPILPEDEQPLEFSCLHHEFNLAGVCGDQSFDQLPFWCPNNSTERPSLVPGKDIFLEGRKIKILRPKIKFIL